MYHSLTRCQSSVQNMSARSDTGRDVYKRQVDGWPVMVEPQLTAGNYRISVRAGVRRGRLPASLRALMFWTDDWHRVSEWYTWSLPG